MNFQEGNFRDLLDSFGIKKNWLNRWPNELSGGELQRFALARALGPKTKYLIADEITTMLDAITQAQIWNTILGVVEEMNIGVLVVSHEKTLIKRLCNNIIFLNDINHACL